MGCATPGETKPLRSMEKFITLNNKLSGPETLKVNVRHIILFSPYGDGSTVSLVDGSALTVAQNPATIEALIARVNKD